jgi:hypothetical protein
MYSNIAKNKRKTVYIFVGFIVFIGLLGWLVAQYLGHPIITPFVLAGSLIYALITYLAGAKMALAVNGAHEIQKKDNPRSVADRRKPGDHRRVADAKGLHHGRPGAERLCDWPRPDATRPSRLPVGCWTS